jgi:hypothetical protein
VGFIVATVALVFGSGAFAQSAAAYYPKPVNTSVPRFSGAAIVGTVLSVTPGHWDAQPPVFYSFEWSSAAGSDLSSTASYTPTTSDVGAVLTVRVTARDGNNNDTYIDVHTAPVVRSDVVSSVGPGFSGGMAVGDTLVAHHGEFTSGSGPLTYSYAWSRTDGRSSVPLADTGSTYLITKADLGFYLSVAVTAKSATQQGSAVGKTPGVVVPQIPFASGAALTSANRGVITGMTRKGVATITDPAGAKGDGVYVYAYSAPKGLGWFALGSDRKFTVSYLGLSVGPHKLVVLDQAGAVVGWIPVTRAAATSPLAATANVPIALAAGVVVLGIVVLIVVTVLRRRRVASRQ